MKKYISPGRWFSLEYPDEWCEFEDAEETFLFYNPNRWDGNFRISAYKDASKDYGRQCVEWELKQNPVSRLVRVGEWDCAYSNESFLEDGTWFTTHIWVTGKSNISFECSFTVAKGSGYRLAEEIVRSLKMCTGREPKEVIPIRLLEIGVVNSSYEWVSTTVKKTLTKDFTSQEEDIDKLQALIDGGKIRQNQRSAWESIGIAFGSIIENEADGMEWVSVIEGHREYPALKIKNHLIDPAGLVWNRMKNAQALNLKAEYQTIMAKVLELQNR